MTPTFETFKNAVPSSSNEALLNLTLANTRARLRMTTLYYSAGIHRSLVAGTGNKIEDFGVGFFTKYGDGGVDVSPIADLMKSEVRAIGEYLQIPTSIIKAKPTDAFENGISIDSLTGREKEVFAIYTRLNRINQHKVNPIPVCTIPDTCKLI